MDLVRILEDLRAERDRLNEAIAVVIRLASGSGVQRRGRPPKWMASSTDQASTAISTVPNRKRKSFSAATRKKMAAAQRKRWAAKKATAA